MIPLNVLFVEDDPADRLAFERFAEERGLPITYMLAGSLREAEGLVGAGKFDLIVTDYSLGDGTAMDLLPFATGIPVILIADKRDEEIAARAFTAGISDSLVKDVGRHYLEQLPERMEKVVGQQLRPVQKLQEDQELYRRVVDTANEGIWIADPDYITSFVNRRMAEMLGYQPAEMVGQPIQQFLFPEDLADFADRTRAQGGTARAQYERRFRHKDGSVRWTILSTTTTLNEQGELRGSFAMVTDITKRKKAEEALRESEQRITSIYNTVGDVIFQLAVEEDGHYRFVSVNRAFLATTGLTSSKVTGKRVDEVIPEPSLTLVLEKYREAIQEKRIVQWEETSEYPTGRLIGEVSVAPVFDGSGNCTHLVGAVHDITERKRVEEALRQSEANYRLLADNTVDGVWLLDMNLKLLYCSPSSEKQSGFTLQEIMAMSLEQYFTPESLKIVMAAFMEEMPKVEADPDYNPIVTLDLEYYKKDGTAFWAESKFSIVRDMHGKPVSILAQARDITERKQLEEALRQSEAKYRSLVETAIEGVASIDTNGNLTFINDALCRLMGYSQEELLNKPFADILHPDDLPALLGAFLSEVAGTRTIASIEFRGIPKTGQSIWFSTQPMAITIDGKIIGFNAILHNITERKRIEDALQASEERYRSLFETMAQGVVYQDAVGQIIHANPAAEKILGLSLDQMQGRTSADPRWRAIHEDGSDFPGETHPAMVALRTGQEVRDVMMGVFNPAKEAYSWIMINAVPQFHPHEGKPYRVYTTFDDITGRKNAEDALRESEERYRSLFEHMVDGYAYCKMLYNDQGHPVDFIYLDVNRTFKRLAGLESVEGKPVSEAIPGIREPYPELFQSYGRVASTGTPEKFEIDFQPSNKWFSISVYSPTREYFVVVFEDITERKRAEDALRESKERLELALIGGDLGFYDWDLQTGMVYTDERYLGMLGYAPGEIDLGCRANWERQVHPDDLSFANYPVQSDLWGETLTYDEEYRMRHKSGEWVWVRDRSRITARAADGRPLRVTGIHENINERKRVEEALYFSNQRLELAQRSAGAGIWDWDMIRQHLDWSRELYLLFGLDPDETEATFDIWHQVLHPDDREIASHRIDQAIADKIPLINEYRVIHPDGQVRWIRALGNTIYDQSGQPLRMAGICIDITERKQAEEKLRKSETLLEEVGEMARVGGWQLDVETKQVLWTSETYRIHEVPQGERIDLPEALLFFDLPGRSTLETALQCCMETGEGFDLELPFTSAKGKQLWTRAMGRAVKSDGKVLSLTGTFQDVTERKQAEEELRESESSLQTILRSTADGLLAVDRENRMLLANERFGEMWKIPREVIICKDDAVLLQYILDQLIDPQGYQDKVQELSVSEEESFDTLTFKDGRVFERLSRPLMLRAELRGRVWSFRDITERTQLEERIRQVRNDLLFSVSHDLKTPLQALNQSQEMLSALAPEEALARFNEYREIWRRNLQRLERMINNLVDSQRGEEDRFPISLASCHLEEIVQRVVGDAQGYTQAKQVMLDLKLEPVPESSCDQEAIARVVENLLTNAVKFSPKGGRVEIRLKQKDQTLLLEVEDHGAGIPASEQTQLFQPFQRGSSVQQKGAPGTGLGLYICRRIMEAHGGSISLTSEEGAGTTVTVRLPLRE